MSQTHNTFKDLAVWLKIFRHKHIFLSYECIFWSLERASCFIPFALTTIHTSNEYWHRACKRMTEQFIISYIFEGRKWRGTDKKAPLPKCFTRSPFSLPPCTCPGPVYLYSRDSLHWSLSFYVWLIFNQNLPWFIRTSATASCFLSFFFCVPQNHIWQSILVSLENTIDTCVCV